MAANQVSVATPGPAGAVGLTYESAWVVDSVYQVRDVVRFSNGNLYICKVQHTATSGNTPVLNTTIWSLFINADDAFQWATKAKHTSITDSLGNTGYSALHQAAKALDWASLTTDAVTNDANASDVGYSAKAWAIGGTEVTTTNLRGAAKEWATTVNGLVDTAEYSAKAYAIGGTGVTTSSGKGAAKEWATTTGGYVDTAEYSAKEYAIGTTVAVGSAKDWAVLAEDSAVTGSSYSALHHAAKAAASATASASSASTGGGSATAAAASATAAAASETAANASADAASAIYDAFHDKYLGEMADGATQGTNPTPTGTWAKDASSIVVSSASNIKVGQVVTGTGIPTSPKPNVVSIAGTTIVLSDNMVAAGSGVTLTFTGYGIYGDFNGTKDGPALNNDGDALTDGVKYFNTTDDVMLVYDETTSAWKRMQPTTTEQGHINTVSGIQANVTTVAGISGNVTTVAGISANTTTVAGISANVTTVAGISANTTTVAGISGNVTTVAGISSDVTAVAADASDIGAVAAKATEIGRLGTADAVADMAILGTTDIVADMALLGTADCVADMALLGTSACVADMAILGTSDVVADLNTLGTADVVADLNTLGTADVVSDLNTLGTADVVSDMNTLGTGGNVTNMNTLAGIAANITTVAGISGNVTTVAGVSANVTTVAGSIADVNRYATEYTIASSAPGGPSEGDLWYDSTNNVLKFHNGTSFVGINAEIHTDMVQDTTPQLGGNLDVNGQDIVSASNGDIDIQPNGSGDTNIKNLIAGSGATGYGIVPVGGIIAVQSGLTGAYSLPSTGAVSTEGWMLCDGATIPGSQTLSGSAPTLNDARFLQGNTHANVGGVGAGTKSLSEGELAAHTHTGAAHTHTGANHNHTGAAHTHTAAAHTHTAAAHTHTAAAHTHTGASHTHTGPSHSHTVNSHTHGGGSHTHGGGSHTHGGGSHTHSIYTGWPPAPHSANSVYSGASHFAGCVANDTHRGSSGGGSATTGSGSATTGSGSATTGSTSPGTNSAGTGATGGTTPGSGGSTTPGASGSTTPADSGSTTPGDSGSSTPGAGGTTTPGTGGSTTPGAGGSTGSGTSFDIIPKYLRVVYLIRVI
jgi:hypothetical protein